MFEKKLLATLRLHSSPITCIETFYLPSSVNFKLEKSNASQFPLFNPSLVTSDESGVIIWWNISTRRPLGIWKAHDDSILTVKQLGLEWKKSEDGANLPNTYESFGQLLTHSKDGTIKIWKLIDVFNAQSLEFAYTGLLKKKLSDDISSVKPPILFEMPVNTLNFTNIDVNSKGYLITPATTESEGFDIYNIDLTQKEEYLKLKRLIQNYKLKSTASSKIEEVTEENAFDPDMDFTKRGGSGVIMKIKWINDDKFVIGYESGKIVMYCLLKQADGEYKIEQCFSDDTMIGNPITSIALDNTNNTLLWSSTASKVCILDLRKKIPDIYDLKHKGVSDIAVDEATNSIGIITWDGYVRLYDYCQDSVLKFISKTCRRAPAIFNSKEAVDSSTTDTNQSNVLDLQRANIIEFTVKQVDPAQNKTIEVIYTNGRCKNVVKRNREDVYGERWMFVGFHDGKISINSIL